MGRAETARMARRLADLATVPRDWIAYWLIMALPIWRMPHWLVSPVLPYAGGWAYRDDPWVIYCRNHWIRTGEPRPPEEYIPGDPDKDERSPISEDLW